MPLWLLCASLALGTAPAASTATPLELRPPRSDAYGDPLPEGAVARLGTSRWRSDIPFSQLAFSSDGTLVAGNTGAEIFLWQFPFGKLIRRFSSPGVVSRSEVMTFSPDKRYLIIRGDFGSVPHRVDLATGKSVPLFKPKPGWIVSTLSADGRTGIWYFNDRGTPHYYLVDTLNPTHYREIVSGMHGNQTGPPFLSADGRMAALIANSQPTGNPGEVISVVTLIDVSTARGWNFPLPMQMAATQVRFSPDGNTAIAVTNSGLYVFEFARGDKPGWKAKGEFISPDDQFAGFSAMLNDRIAFTSDGKYVVTSTAGVGVMLWDLRTRKCSGYLCSAMNGGGFCLALSPDGRTLITSNDGSPGLHLWDLATRAELLVRVGHTGSVSRMLFSSSSNAMISEAADGEVFSWNLQPIRHYSTQAGGRKVAEDRYPSRPWSSLSPSQPNEWAMTQLPAGDRALYAYSMSESRVYRFPLDGKHQRTPISEPEQDFGQFLVSPNGKTLVIGRNQEGIQMFDVATGSPSKTQISIREQVGQMFFSPNGKTLATRELGSPQLHFWNLTTGREMFRPPAEAAAGKGVRNRYWSSFGQLQGLGNQEIPNIRRIWDRTNGRLVREFDNLEGPIALSPSGYLMAWVSNDEITLLETASGKEIYRFHSKKSQPAAAKTPPGTPRLAGLAAAGQPASYQMNFVAQSRVTSLEFSPDGKLLAAGYADGSILLWDCTPPQPKSTPSDADLTAAWKALRKPSSEEVYRAMGTLAAAPSSTIALLHREMKLPEPVDPLVVHQLLNHLDHRRYEVREKATNRLSDLAPLIEEKLIAEAGHVSLEASTRIMRVLDALCRSDADSETLRLLRVVTVLEQINNTEAHTLLQKIAGSHGPAANAARDAIARR